MKEIFKSDISLEQYRIFYIVVTCQSMSKAADELFISQPAVSMAISKLETAYKGKLLIRNKSGVRPTPEGQMLFEYLEQAFSLISKAETTYSRMADLNSGQIRIGASDTLSAGYLLPYLERFHSKYPEINIEVTNRVTSETISLIRNDVVEIGFVNLPCAGIEDMEVSESMKIHDCLVAGGRFAELKRGIELNSLSNHPLLMLEKNSSTRQYIDNFAKNSGVELAPKIELGSSDLLLEFARINLGIAFVIREFSLNKFSEITDELGRPPLFEIPLIPPIPPRAIGFVRKKSAPLSFAAEKFISLLTEKM